MGRGASVVEPVGVVELDAAYLLGCDRRQRAVAAHPL